MATKTECLKFLLDNLIETDPIDFAVVDLWTTLSTLVDYVKREDVSKRLKERVMYNVRSLLKGMIYAESS